MRLKPLARLDPRAKLVAFLAVQALLFLPPASSPHLRLPAVALVLLPLLPFAGRSWRLWLRLLALAAPLLAFLSIGVILRPSIGAGGPARIVLPLLGKFLLVFLALALFVLNEEPWRILQALRQAGLPPSVSVILALGHRFSGQMRLDLEEVRRAWTARNFSVLPLRRRIGTVGRTLPAFFERLLENGVHIHDAMAGRGFGGTLPEWQILRFAPRDAVFLLLTAIAVGGIAGLA
ncbi:MAG: hypothetical protein JXO51_00965 [Candidatus Aminicenantes bacterium]|nr:hypothetical protein [Candidatus Aminicenantes bacterium]